MGNLSYSNQFSISVQMNFKIYFPILFQYQNQNKIENGNDITKSDYKNF